MFTVFIWNEDEVYIKEVVGAVYVDRFVDNFTDKHSGAVMICTFQDPSGIGSADTFKKLFEGQLCSDGGYALTRDQMREVYRMWRKCFAQGYAVSEIFNVSMWDIPFNPVITPEKHYTFDIRLGYLIYTDRRCLSVIGKGGTCFEPRVNYPIRAVNSWMFEYHGYRPDGVSQEEKDGN